MAKVAITGAEVVDPEAIHARSATLLVESGRIADCVAPGEPLGGDWRRVSRDGLCVAPGFLDLHFHGELVAAAPPEFAGALARAGARMLAEGTTAFLATTVCWPRAELAAAVDALVAALDRAGDGSAQCLGLHLEGPWISAEAPGAMAPTAIRPFDANDDELLDRAGDRLRMVTLAPEVEGAGALLAALGRRNVVAALGHTRASEACIADAVARGLRHVTHLWNAMGPMHHREPGVAGAVLADDHLTCDLICDGHHVAPAMVRVAARALGERLILITDRVEIPAREPRRSALGAAVAGRDGAPYRRSDGTIVGSQLGLDGAVRNARRFAKVGLAEAVAACTLRPARLLGLERERGTLRRGARADLALLDAAGHVVETWIGGEPVWRRAP